MQYVAPNLLYLLDACVIPWIEHGHTMIQFEDKHSLNEGSRESSLHGNYKIFDALTVH